MPFFHQGFLRVAVASPRVTVADPAANARAIAELLRRAEGRDVAVAVFPELCLTGYTCGDLFGQAALLAAALAGLGEVLRLTEQEYRGVAIVGLPLAVENCLFNAVAVLHRGKILGVVPKSYLPTYKEFYEHRWFAPAAKAACNSVSLFSRDVHFGTNQLFVAEDIPGLSLGVEICEDLWMPVPPSSYAALRGATVLANASASTEIAGKAPYRRMLVASQSGRCQAAYLYAASPVTESTTDVVFGGHSLIAENGVILAESERFCPESLLTVADVDLERLVGDRLRQGTISDALYYHNEVQGAYRFHHFRLEPSTPPIPVKLERHVGPHPFVPAALGERDERCAEIFQIQVAGLAKRLEVVGDIPLSIGVSGGLDSTLALLVACQTLDLLRIDRARLQAFTMRGFGSTKKTKELAVALIGQFGATHRETDIRELCLEEMRVLGHQPFGIDLAGLDVDQFTERLRAIPASARSDLVFENVQARMRTSLLMNAGFVVGTGDLSELALGWCTYNGDQISMYNPNVGVPKTLVRFLIRWVADHHYRGQPLGELLHQIADQVITPELLPTGPGGDEVQATEASIGPYELQDFYLYHFLRFGFKPEKLLLLAGQATFDAAYPEEERRRWLKVFLKRFFASQFKRSCLPDGPKVGSVSLSPRGDWRMPSDASAGAWLDET